jgi:hypothetical protein
MKKQVQLILVEEKINSTEAKLSENNTFRNKVYKARIADDMPTALNAGTRLFESRFIIDPRDGNLKLTNNPALLIHDIIKRNFDGSLQSVNKLGEELLTSMNHCDEYIWIEKENGEIRGI